MEESKEGSPLLIMHVKPRVDSDDAKILKYFWY